LRRVLILLVITIILIGAGFVSITLSQQASSGSTGAGGGVFQVQTDNPDASVLAMTAQKGELLVGLVLLTLAVLGGLTTGLTLITWFLTREISHVRKAPDRPFSFSLNSTQPNSLGYMLARRPAVTVGVSLVALFVVVGLLALLGAFAPR
jgi:hypothetical protein